jgi:hypothetical protein
MPTVVTETEPRLIINALLLTVCRGCKEPIDSKGPIQCAIIKAIRQGTLDPTQTEGHLCALALYCNKCQNINGIDCPAKEAIMRKTSPEQTIDPLQKATDTVIIANILPDCPKDLYSFVE